MRDDLPTGEQLAEQLANCDDRVARERLERAYQRRLSLGEADRLAMPVWGWRVGEAVIVATPAEAYSLLQVELRQRFPGRPIAVINMVNGHAGYLPSADVFPSRTYQVETSLFASGCLAETLRVCVELVERLEQIPLEDDEAE